MKNNKMILSLLISSSILISSCSKEKNNLSFLKKDNSKPIASKIVKTNSSNSLVIVKENSSNNITSVLNNSSEPVKTTTSSDNKVDITLIPIKFSIQYKNGTGSNQIAVFLDLNQDYSKDFINSISSINNTTVNVFMINGDQEAIDKIYCSDNKQQSLTSYLNNLKIDNSNRNCDRDGLEYSSKYFQNNLQDKTLPVIIFSDGNVVENATSATPDLLNKYLENK